VPDNFNNKVTTPSSRKLLLDTIAHPTLTVHTLMQSIFTHKSTNFPTKHAESAHYKVKLIH